MSNELINKTIKGIERAICSNLYSCHRYQIPDQENICNSRLRLYCKCQRFHEIPEADGKYLNNIERKLMKNYE
jgi:hypothetical protein